MTYSLGGTGYNTEFDYLGAVTATITYEDGDTDTASINIMQDSDGRVFVIRNSTWTDGTSDLYAKPIESITPTAHDADYGGFNINRATIVEQPDNFVLLTDAVWDGTSQLVPQLSPTSFNVNGLDTTGTTTAVAESTTGTFINGNGGTFYDTSGAGAGGAEDIYKVEDSATLTGSQDIYSLAVRTTEATITLLNGKVFTNQTVQLRALQDGTVLLDLLDADLVDYNVRSEIARIDLTTQQYTNYVGDNPLALDAAYAPVCYVTGSRILTDRGWRKVETLGIGTKVWTLDGGYQQIRWLGYSRPQEGNGRDCYGITLPDSLHEQLWVSQQHRVLCDLEGEEVLIPAKKLSDLMPMERRTLREEDHFWHILLPRHHIIRANGILAESFFPGPTARDMLGEEVWRGLRRAMPEGGYPTELARREIRRNPEIKAIRTSRQQISLARVRGTSAPPFAAQIVWGKRSSLTPTYN
ncbi:Hint domain-containing protein [Palleronia caenipelagi]|uniref:Hedgehog/Intein (Hint) domain-containing protein n=1 Tax=Palleronia caenipelagi TaxID=2489174 RepID=A0A547Q9V9_9RHOB|nr:Hint domain-containing protein [Palleronia caenipelagi]TRD23168.1 hypothetical protein FEV53_01010 [Palleronia caenipelagi]